MKAPAAVKSQKAASKKPAVTVDGRDVAPLTFDEVIVQRKACACGGSCPRCRGAHTDTTVRAGLPKELRASVETHSGVDMSNVRVHRNSPAPARYNAHAYTHGQDIHLAPGQERHLAHEAWHVVQQAQGRVPTTAHINGMPLNENAGLEAEADRMAHQLSGAPSAAQQRGLSAPASVAAPPIQRQVRTGGGATKINEAE